MAEVASSGCQSLPYEVVFWDSEAPEYEGHRIRFSEPPSHATPGQVIQSGWRSDRRCRFPVEVGLHLHRPCRLQQVVVVSEPGLAPSVIEFFVAGPTRSEPLAEKNGWKRGSGAPSGADSWNHNGSKKVSTEAARAGYLSSMFVRIGRASFCNGVETPSLGSHVGSLPPGTPLAELSGLSFKGQFLRLVIWEAAGSHDNPGRQVSITHVHVLGSPSGDERRGQPKVTAATAGAALKEKGRLSGDTTQNVGDSCAGAFSAEEGDVSDREENLAVEQALAGLGIEPKLMAGHGVRRQHAGAQGRGGEDGGGGEQRESWDAWCGVVEEATCRVREMLQVAHSEERFNEAEQLSTALNRVLSLGASVRSARRAQRKASRREDFDEAKRCRDKAMDAEVWLRQTVRDASETFEGGARSAADASPRFQPPSAAAGPAASAGQECNDEKTTAGDCSNTNTTHSDAEASPEEGEVTTAPFHDATDACSPGQKRREEGIDKDGDNDGDCTNIGDLNDKNDVFPPWLDPTRSRSTEPWKLALLTLPWPRGVRPDFRTVFSHGCEGWTSPSSSAACADKPSGTAVGTAIAETRCSNRVFSSTTMVCSAAPDRRCGGQGGKVGGGGQSTISCSQQPGALLRTVLRLVAASQDLRPPGPVPPDVAPFRRAGKADRRRPLCTFFFSTFPSSLSPDTSFEEMLASIQDEADTAKHGIRREQDERFGRAFALPAADATPSATAVTNWVEDNPKLAWGGPLVLCFPFFASPQKNNDTGRHRLRRPSRDDSGEEGDSTAPAHGKEKAEDNSGERKSANGNTERQPELDGDADVADSAGDHVDTSDTNDGDTKGSRRSSTDLGGCSSSADGTARRGAADRTVAFSFAAEFGGSLAVHPATVEVAEQDGGPLAYASGGLERSAACFLPDFVGAGGFSEFVPLLEAVFGRVPIVAACAGFPAKMRESAIRICQAHLERTVDVALEAFQAAAAPTDTSNEARGAVFRAASLVAAQGLMDPADSPRLAAESLVVSAMSLWSSTTEAVAEEIGAVGNEDGEPEGESRAPTGARDTRPVVVAALPLRDLRWGLEIVLACVAPYLADGIPEVEDNNPDGENQLPTTLNGGDKHPVGTFDDGKRRRSSTTSAVDDSRQAESTPAEGQVALTANTAASGGVMAGQASGSGGTESPNDDTAKRRQTFAQERPGPGRRRSALPRCSIELNGGAHDDCAERRSRLALRLVDVACRHPDVGPALVSSILVSWIPSLLRWGGIPSSGPAYFDSTAGLMAAGSGSGDSGACSSIAANFGGPAGEMAASEALASGAIHMLAFMVRTFPLLPLSEFSAETLAGAAEGGMAFEARRNTSCKDRSAATRMPTRGKSGTAGRRYDRRSSTSGRAPHAGQTLMLDLFLHAGTSGSGGGRLAFVNDILPALNTSRGINFVHETSNAFFTGTTSRDDRHEKTMSRGGSGDGGGGQRGGRVGEEDCMTGAAVADRAAGYFLGAAVDKNAVEIRERLPVPITRQPPKEAAAVESTTSNLHESVLMIDVIRDEKDGGGDNVNRSAVLPVSEDQDEHNVDGHVLPVPTMSDEKEDGDGDGHHSAVPPSGNDDKGDGHNLPRGDTEYQHMSDSSSAGLSLLTTSNSSGTIDSLQSKEEVASATTSTAIREDKPKTVSGESKKGNKVFPLSTFGDGGEEELAGNEAEGEPGVAQEPPVAMDEAAGSGTERGIPREELAGAKKDKKIRGGGFISRLFRRGKT